MAAPRIVKKSVAYSTQRSTTGDVKYVVVRSTATETTNGKVTTSTQPVAYCPMKCDADAIVTALTPAQPAPPAPEPVTEPVTETTD